MRSLCVVDDLLLLCPDLLLPHPLDKLVFFCLLNHFSFKLYLLLQTVDLLPQEPFPLVSFKFVLLTKNFANLALLYFIRYVDLFPKRLYLFYCLLTLMYDPCFIFCNKLASL